MEPRQSLYKTLADTARRYPDFTALQLMGKDLLYRDFLDDVHRTAGGMRSLGIRSGDVLTICMPNVFPCLFLFYAANQIGAICHMVHPLTPANQMERFLKETDSRWLFALDSFHQTYTPLLERMDLRIVLSSPAEGLSPIQRLGYRFLQRKRLKDIPWEDRVLPFSRLLGKDRWEEETAHDPRSTSILLHSGGTSGSPKTIELSDFAVNSLAMKAEFILEEENLTGKGMLAVLPMFHGFGLCMGVHGLLGFGGTDILMPKFNVVETIRLLKKGKINYIIGVPTLFEALLAHPDFPGPHLKNLRRAYVGGDFVSPTLKRSFDEVMQFHASPARLLEGYGLTEVVTVCAVNRLGDYRPDTVGRPLPGIQVRILDLSTRQPLPPGVPGEIAVAGDTRMNAYYKDPEATDKTFWKDTEGTVFVLTGDFGHLNEDGHLVFRQRMKRIVKVSGMPVMPSEIETLVTAFDGVAEAAALGVLDPERGSMIHLVIRMKTPETRRPEEKAIMQKIKEELSVYAVPKTIEYVDTMPHTLIGKIDIPALEARLSAAPKA
ncbi:MAG TPA: class I adenylate-forming enzyme family protein [Candidatus Izemoplasmatales bacterium]|nr:class I adenylate-forming enzyme family protein [Candidatus Izemoplasmatales bacterium]